MLVIRRTQFGRAAGKGFGLVRKKPRPEVGADPVSWRLPEVGEAESPWGRVLSARVLILSKPETTQPPHMTSSDSVLQLLTSKSFRY